MNSRNNTRNHMECFNKHGHYEERQRKCNIHYWPETVCVRIKRSKSSLQWENLSNSKNRAEGCAFRTKFDQNDSVLFEHKTNNLEVWDKMVF